MCLILPNIYGEIYFDSCAILVIKARMLHVKIQNI